MFTIEQLKSAHSKVKSGADFPYYIQEMKALGVTSYDFYVGDGHSQYHGANNFAITSEGRWPARIIGPPSSVQLRHDLLIHQSGQTDYFIFCQQAAAAGVEKWITNIVQMTCTYYDNTGNIMLIEAIPDTNAAGYENER